MSHFRRLDQAFRTQFATIPADTPPEHDPGVIDVTPETFPDLEIVRKAKAVIDARAHIREPGKGKRS